MDWEDLRHFLAVARTGTASGAAKALRTSTSTVIKRVSDLEQALGAPLFDRSRDGYALTRFGEAIVEHAEGVEASALGIARLSGGNPDIVTGPIRLATTEMLGTYWLAPKLPELHRHHPGLSIEIVASPGLVSLTRREADISLRLTRPTRGDLVARCLGALGFAVYGQAGVPPSELEGRWIGFDDDMRNFSIPHALEQRMAGAEPILRTTLVAVQLQAARAGLGKIYIPCFVGDSDPLLQRMPDPFPPFAVEIWVVLHHDLRRSPRVRAVLNFIVAEVARDKHWLEGSDPSHAARTNAASPPDMLGGNSAQAIGQA